MKINRMTQPAAALHGNFSIEKRQKDWGLGGVMVSPASWVRISIGEKFADLVGFTRLMEHAAANTCLEFFCFAS